MGQRRQRLAAALAFVAIAEVVAIFVISAAGSRAFQVALDLPSIGFTGSIVAFPVVGALILQRRPSTRVAWLMVALGVLMGFGLLLYGYGAVGEKGGGPLPGAQLALILSQLFFLPSTGVATALILLLFPSDHVPGPRWRNVAYLAVIGGFLFETGTILRPGAVDPDVMPGMLNPFGAPASLGPILEILIGAGNGLVVISILLAAGSLVVRYRRASPIEAAQIRWIALVGILAAVTLSLGALQAGPVSDFMFGLGLVLLACLPFAIGIAITRYRLYDIDRLINRALVYGSLTAILAGVFTAGVGLAQRLFIAVTSQTSDAAVVGATLVVATLYAPLRKRLEAVIDQRFKFEDATFGAYRDELVRLLSATDPERAAARLVGEAVRELPAVGAATLDARGAVTASAGRWPVEPLVRMTIPGGAGPLRVLAIGPRPDGELHDPRALAALEELAALVAAAAAPPLTEAASASRPEATARRSAPPPR